MNPSVMKEFERYLDEQSLENYLRLRESLAAAPEYTPYKHSLSEIYSCLDREEFAKVPSAFRTLMPTYFLSPRAHKLLAFAHHKSGDEKHAQMELHIGELCLQGIKLTGTGEESKPYLVLLTDDEYDVLESQSRTSTLQRLVKGKNNRHFDCHKCDDGAEVWFDITTPYSHLERSFSGGGR